MKQVVQDLRHGATKVVDVPVPWAAPGQLLIASTRSLISAGTERMLVQFGQASLLDKARQQPEKVRQAWDKVRSDGLAATIDAIRAQLDQPLPLGYCNTGRVIDIGSGVSGWSIGDRVASSGRHAEFVAVPAILCARVPECVSDDAAAFTIVGAVGLHGVRLAAPTLGECFVVIGLGLIGQIIVQLLRAHGCRVLGVDFDAERVSIARKMGFEAVNPRAGEDLQSHAIALSRGRGVDGVLIAASTDSNEPIRQAAQICRKRGRIVLVGVTGLELSRSDFYEKELTFQVSCSYGPGRYDPLYEVKGQDYPVPYVRWTEQRNFEAFLDMLAARQLDVLPLITHRFDVSHVDDAYRTITHSTDSLGVLLEYREPSTAVLQRSVVVSEPCTNRKTGRISIALIGAGKFAVQTLAAGLAKIEARRRVVASTGGLSAVQLARKLRFEHATSDTHAAITDSEVDAVIIATRHDSHAELTIHAIENSKDVLVEKPLALNLRELDLIDTAYRESVNRGRVPVLMVGFNRRFAPHMVRLRELLSGRAAPLVAIYTVNAGSIPRDHWTRDELLGGGRIVGEACHFVDALRFLVGKPITRSRITSTGAEDEATIVLEFDDSSIGTIHYLANGHRAFPKERLEVFCGGRIVQLDNFRRFRSWGWPHAGRDFQWRPDKGHAGELAAFVDGVTRRTSPIPYTELIEVSRVTCQLANEIRRGRSGGDD